MRFLNFGNTNLQYRRKLLSLGLTPGTVFLVTHLAPLGCPVAIEVRGTSITLRKDEANSLQLERL